MILDNFRLDGRVALVTGASQGLGQSMAIGLAEAGADIVALDRNSSEQTGHTVSGLGRRFKEIRGAAYRATGGRNLWRARPSILDSLSRSRSAHRR